MEHRIKTRLGLVNYCRNTSMKTIFMNTENCKTNKLNKSVIDLLQRLDLKNSDKFVAFQNLSLMEKYKTAVQKVSSF